MATAELFIKMTFDRWNGSITNLNAILNSITDEALLKEIAPGKKQRNLFAWTFNSGTRRNAETIGFGRKILSRIV